MDAIRWSLAVGAKSSANAVRHSLLLSHLTGGRVPKLIDLIMK